MFIPLSNKVKKIVFFLLTISSIILFSSIGLSAETYAVPQTTEVTLAWDHNDPLPEGYRIYQRQEGSAYDYSAPVWAGTANTAVVYNIEYNVTYYFVVRAYSGSLESSDSVEVSFMAETPAPQTYTISAVIGGNGTISPAGATIITEGTNQTYSITPDSGYHIADVFVDGASQGAIAGYTFSSVDADHTIEAVFEVDNTDETADNGGTDSPLPEETDSNETSADSDSGSDSTTSTSPAGSLPIESLEMGDIAINHNWKRVSFEKIFVNPVVVAGPMSLNGGQPGVIRIKNVDATGFDIRVQEWNYLDGWHATETVSYLVMEQGSYTLADGTVVEARNLETSAASSYQTITFEGSFNVSPVVMTTLTSDNDDSAVTGRIKGVSVIGFSYRMQEEEANAQDHGKERLSYIAWEPSSGMIEDISYQVDYTASVVKTENYDIITGMASESSPVVLADMQTSNGSDTVAVRSGYKSGTAFGVQLQEETSLDDEVAHVSENIGYMVLGRNTTDISNFLEMGDIAIDHNWKRVSFEKSFVNPVVVAGPMSLNGGQPGVIRIKNVDATGFDIRVQEWNYLDGWHATETVSYLVMEQGSYTLADGTVVEARNLETSAASSYQAITFEGSFNVSPVVMTTLTSDNDDSAVTGRIKGVSVIGFSYRMQEEEANAQDHGKERLSYIAWEPSSGMIEDISYQVDYTASVVKTENYDIITGMVSESSPVVLADMQTSNGSDTVAVRSGYKSGTAFGVQLQEETSLDDEVAHVAESIGYFVLHQ